jgi:RimJ/RimL family protein N-acetyltransferase
VRSASPIERGHLAVRRIVPRLRAGTSLARAALTEGREMPAAAMAVGLGAGAGWLAGLLLAWPAPATAGAGATAGVLWLWWAFGGRFAPPLAPATLARLRPMRGERVAVRPLTAADAGALVDALDGRVATEMGWTDQHVADYRQFMRRHRSLVRQLGHLAICDGTDQRVLGEVSLTDLDEGGGTAELGLWLGPQGRGRGLSTEAFRLAFAVYHDAGVPVIRCGTGAHNLAVQRVLPRVGATVVGNRPQRRPDGSTVDTVWFEHRSGT